MHPAIVLLEFDSIAVGIEAGDAMAKRAPLESLHTGSVQPGKYIILAGGEVGDVEEARTAGRETGSRALVDEIFLPEVHGDVVTALTGGRRPAVRWGSSRPARWQPPSAHPTPGSKGRR